MTNVVRLNTLTVPDDAQVIAAGQRAWAEEKFSKERQLHRWHEIGKALLVGREATNGHKPSFGAWCEEQGFGDIHTSTRTDALWLAENWEEVRFLFNDGHRIEVAHPSRIRKAYRKAQSDAPDTSQMTSVDAEYIRKLDTLANHPETPKHEAAVAAAKRDEMVSKYDVDLDQLREEAEVEKVKADRERDLDVKLENLFVRLKQKPIEWLAFRLFKAALADPELLIALSYEVTE